jgi:hypothetical protein
MHRWMQLELVIFFIEHRRSSVSEPWWQLEDHGSL